MNESIYRGWFSHGFEKAFGNPKKSVGWFSHGFEKAFGNPKKSVG